MSHVLIYLLEQFACQFKMFLASNLDPKKAPSNAGDKTMTGTPETIVDSLPKLVMAWLSIMSFFIEFC